ncbi:hypothetical protein AX16_000858 [Volvariella volvacea WC 439]|nr:hypothetical protein AX16_000858 [Volvariella volvacea WC 439]
MHQIDDEPTEKLRSELENAVADGIGTYTSDLFTGLALEDSRIRDFLKETRHYNFSSRRWNKYPNHNSKSSSAFREQVTSMIQAIYAYFNIQNRRAICNKKRSRSKFTQDPDVMISGCGSTSFKGRNLQLTLDYIHCATPIAVRFNDQMQASDMHVQLGFYARECFAAQLNRRFVYALWFTEDMLAVHQFDRSGCIWSEGIGIHESPERVVRWILGVSSPDEVALGFNTTIRWRGRRRYVQTLNSEQEPAEYEIDLNEKIIHSPCIVGTGTTCWPLIGDDGPWLMKEYWRELNEQREEEFLVAVRGVQGVAQVVSYEIGETTSDIRAVEPRIGFRPRQFIRITQKQYGSPITQLQSPLQLLRVFRDAVQGHRNLLNKGILHRNVSCDNIVLANKDDAFDNSGVLINLSHAIWDYKSRNWDDPWPSGICPFQSIVVLKGGNGRNSFLDDLESFFYVLLFICVGYDAPGKRKDQLPSCLSQWYDIDHDACAITKSEQLRAFDDHFLQHISPCFDPTFIELLKELLAVFWTGGLPMHQPRPLLHLEESRKHLLVDPNAIYQSYLSSIDCAIKKLERAELSPISAPDAESPLTTPPKRKLDDSAEDDRDICPPPPPPRKRPPIKAEVINSLPQNRSRRATRKRKT